MNRLTYRIAALSTLLIAGTVAQDLGTTVHVGTTPDGLEFFIDGVLYGHSMSMFWPVGSKHVLSVPLDINQNATSVKARYAFQSWQYAGTALPGGNTVTISAGPPMTNITAVYTVTYALSLNYFNCQGVDACNASGVIYVNGTPYTGNQDIFFAQGAQVQLMAVPNPGYVFTGWLGAGNQVVQGSTNTV